MKLQPYVQSSVATRSNKKLSFRYYGPFRVLQRIGQVAYKLNLLATSRIHPVIHVSQLKKHIPNEVEVTQDLTSVCTNPEQILKPEKILNTRLIQRGAVDYPTGKYGNMGRQSRDSQEIWPSNTNLRTGWFLRRRECNGCMTSGPTRVGWLRGRYCCSSNTVTV
jgi:hypothetical protein